MRYASQNKRIMVHLYESMLKLHAYTKHTHTHTHMKFITISISLKSRWWFQPSFTCKSSWNPSFHESMLLEVHRCSPSCMAHAWQRITTGSQDQQSDQWNERTLMTFSKAKWWAKLLNFWYFLLIMNHWLVISFSHIWFGTNFNTKKWRKSSEGMLWKEKLSTCILFQSWGSIKDCPKSVSV